jgi:hypothetical protein
MRYSLALALLLAGPAFAAQEMVAKSGDDVVRLIDLPCPYGSVLRFIPEEARRQFRKSEARISGQRFFACFRLVGDRVQVVYEDGDVGYIPAGEFKEEPGV